jgi:hypothetical protein
MCVYIISSPTHGSSPSGSAGNILVSLYVHIRYTEGMHVYNVTKTLNGTPFTVTKVWARCASISQRV